MASRSLLAANYQIEEIPTLIVTANGKEIGRFVGITREENVAKLLPSSVEVKGSQLKQYVVYDFWAPWCGPCRMIAPMIQELASEYTGSVKVGKINIDESPSAATSYGVSSIPTLMIFKGGEVVDRFVGVQPKNRLQQAMDAAKT